MSFRKQYFTILFSMLLLSTLLSAANWTHTTVGMASSSTRPVICSDPLGNLHVAWSSGDYVGVFIQYATNQSGSWSIQQQVAGSSGNQAYSPSITADNEGNAYIVFRYYGYNYEPRYVTNREITNIYWSLNRSWNGGHYHEASIEVDSDYQTHVFAQEDTYGSNVYYQQLDVNNIVIPNITQFFSSAIDNNDTLHFVGYNGDGIFYCYRDGTTWSNPDTIDQIEASAYQPTIACDSDNVLHVAFASSNGIYYLNNSGGDWSVPELATDGSNFPDIIVDENGKAHIVFSIDGALFYINNINGTWSSAELVANTNSDGLAHVESKIALDSKSNTVNIVYIDSDGSTVKVAQTGDFNLRSTKSTDITSTLVSLAAEPPAIDTVSTSTTGSMEMLQFSINDNGGDGFSTKMKELIVQRGPGMSVDICFNDVFSKVTITGTDGTNLDGSIYASRIIFGSLDETWKEIPENTSYAYTISATYKEPLQNVDGKSVQMKINALYDIIADKSGSCFAYNSESVLSDTILFQVVPDRYEFVNLGDDFFGKNLVEGWWMQLKIVDAAGIVAASVNGIDVTLSAVRLDGITPTTAALQSTDALTKTFTNGIAQFTNITYPDSGQFRILATCDVLTAASDTITILPHHKTLLIAQPDENIADVLDRLNIEYDFYKASNYAFPSQTNLLSYQTIILDAPYSVASYFDSTSIKIFLQSGTAENPKAILAAGDNGLGYYSDTDFADTYFGGRIQNWYPNNVSTILGVNNDPISDGLTLNVFASYPNTITPNNKLGTDPVFLTLPQTEYIMGTKVETEQYRTVLLSLNFSAISSNTQKDTLVNRIIQWFQSSTIPQTYGPELTDLPDIEMTEDTPHKMALSEWYPYVEDLDTPDKSLSWDLSDGLYCDASIENDTLMILPNENFYGKDTLSMIVTDGQLADTGSVIIKIAPVNDPPNEFSLLTPEDGYWTNYDQDSSELFFSWTHAKDIDEDSINYKLTIYTDLYGSDTFTVPDTSVLIDYTTSTCIESNIAIYWTVTAFDLKDSTIASNAPFGFSLLSPEAISDSDHLIPIDYCLYPNYPNPFNPETTIKYGLPEESFVTISIYDISGRLMETLVRE
ncbi:MAG: hypothetical protein JXR87_06960, partial [Candidatus Marinimicrobia bacterium]|nr:hypothetical protein [Candidatus Neomarinimicrobiota bacterium]